jgi:hypothetical protein
MHKQTQDGPIISPGSGVNRRDLLRRAVVAGAAITSVGGPLTQAKAEIWEEGDIQCRPVVQEKAPDYDVNDALLTDFMDVSETLTGVKPLDRRIGVQYLERYARHPDLSPLLPPLIKAYNAVKEASPLPDDLIRNVREKIMQDQAVGPAAEQLIYLWYVSAFFLPTDHTAASRNWLYGSPEQYEAALLWPIVHGHAPMTRGGPTGYWARAPRV